MLRDLTTFSNFAGCATALRAKQAGECRLATALFLASVLSLAFHATEGDEVHLVGGLLTVRHGLDDGLLVGRIVANAPACTREWFHVARRNTDVMLAIDEIGALAAFATTCAACGGPRATLSTALSPRFRFATVVAAVAIIASDLVLSGAPHAVLHAVWHVIAFTLPLELVLASRRGPGGKATSTLAR
jgi:hypothetical protein